MKKSSMRLFIRVSLINLVLFIHSIFSLSSAAILLWPTQLHVEQNQKATALWLENKGNNEQVVQVRVFAWTQIHGEDTLDKQAIVMASPPISRIAPGSRQLIRIINRVPVTQNKMAHFRVVIDEIPQAVSSKKNGAEELTQGIKFQLRYSIPLFFYGKGLSLKSNKEQSAAEIGKNLSWKTVQEDKASWVTIKNNGPYYVMLNEAKFTSQPNSSGFSGYILPGSTIKWKLNGLPTANDQLQAIINKQSIIIKP